MFAFSIRCTAQCKSGVPDANLTCERGRGLRAVCKDVCNTPTKTNCGLNPNLPFLKGTCVGSMLVFVCLCVCVCIELCAIYIYAYIPTCIHACMHACIQTNRQTGRKTNREIDRQTYTPRSGRQEGYGGYCHCGVPVPENGDPYRRIFRRTVPLRNSGRISPPHPRPIMV